MQMVKPDHFPAQKLQNTTHKNNCVTQYINLGEEKSMGQKIAYGCLVVVTYNNVRVQL